jgi:uncharacterized membrane protein YgcG
MFRSLLFVFSFCVLLSTGYAQQAELPIPARPEPRQLLNDEAALLSNPSEKKQLSELLQKLQDSAGVEILVATIQTIPGTDAYTYTQQLATKWTQDYTHQKWVLIAYEAEGRGYAIVAGQGYEAQLSPAILKKIEAQYLKPSLKNKDYYEAFAATGTALANHITGKLTDAQLIKADHSLTLYLVTLAIFIFFLILFPVIQYARFRKTHFSTKKIGFRSTFMLMNNMKPSQSTFEDFQKGNGPFSLSEKASGTPVHGGGAGGSWGSW